MRRIRSEHAEQQAHASKQKSDRTHPGLLAVNDGERLARFAVQILSRQRRVVGTVVAVRLGSLAYRYSDKDAHAWAKDLSSLLRLLFLRTHRADGAAGRCAALKREARKAANLEHRIACQSTE